MAFAPCSPDPADPRPGHADAKAAPDGNGSASAPFRTIQAALGNGALADGDTVALAPGEYVENVSIEAEITLLGVAGPGLTILRPALSGSGAPTLDSGNPTLSPVVRGLTTQAGQLNFSTAVWITTGLLEHCIVVGSGRGVGVEACSQATIRGCTITRLGIGVSDELSTCSPLVRDSIVYGNAIDLSGVNAAYTCYGAQDVSVIGPGSFVAAPGWLDGAALDLHLALGSACIDAGDPSSLLDPDGSPADLGAFRFDASDSPLVSSYCTSKTNSIGCVPSIAACGVPSVSSPTPFTIHAILERNQLNGLLFWCYAPLAQPYQAGFLCVHAPTRRSAILNASGSPAGNDCTGVYSIDLRAVASSGVDPLLIAPTTVYCQFWSRDAQAPFGSNRTNALRVDLVP